MVYFGKCCVDCSLRPMLMVIQAGVLCKWVADSQRFLLEHFDTIHDSPSHIYHSALPLSPSSSWLHKCYSANLSPRVKVVKGLPTEWGMCSHTISLDNIPLAFSYQKNAVAVGFQHKDIITFNAITGSYTAVFSGHTSSVTSLVFSSDGISLVSGSNDTTVKLWDVQTGGVIKTFSGHTHWVLSVSISADHTRIASGSKDKTIRLWDIQRGECHHTMWEQGSVYHVCFSPTNPQYLLSRSNDKITRWDISNHKSPLTYDGSCVAFSPDGTQFVMCNGAVVTIQNSDSRVIMARFYVADSSTYCCCFSPDCRLVAVAVGNIAYIWDITNLDPHLVETFIGHTSLITSLVFPSPTSLISASEDKLVKFWQIGTLPTELAMTDPKSTPLTSAPIKSITLQAGDGITISSDLDGVVKIFNISTGICKASFQTPAKNSPYRDVRLIDDRLIFVWYGHEKINICDLETGELLWAVNGSGYIFQDLKISGDGLKVFCLDSKFLHALSLQAGEVVGKVEFEHFIYSGSLTVDDSRVWIHHHQSVHQGWNFQIPGSPPIQLPSVSPDRLHLTGASLSRIKDVVTRKVVFQLSGRFAKPTAIQFDGQYLTAGYDSGELLILEFNHAFPQ